MTRRLPGPSPLQGLTSQLEAHGGQVGADSNRSDLIVTEAEAASMLRLSERSLQRYRLEGGGPAFVRLTGRRVGYTREALNAWIQVRSVANTAQQAGGAR